MNTSAREDVLEWLMAGDPAIRWQVMRDLLGSPPAEVAAERARVETEGWGAALLARQDTDGQWAGGAYFPQEHDASEPGQPWTSTMHALQTLRILGLEPRSAAALQTVPLVAENCRWEHDGQHFFDGEVEPCINGRTVEAGAYFGADVDSLVERLLGERLDDGGWNCEAEFGSVRSSFHSTIDVLDGLLAYERRLGLGVGAAGEEGTTELARRAREARLAGEEYLLERKLFRRKSTGAVVDPSFLEFAFPYYWVYDVLRALDYFGSSGRTPDPRIAEAVRIVADKQQPDGRWLLDVVHPGRVHFHMEQAGKPSRWNTLRALRVLDWWTTP